jgi:indole-3-glycerol phosphate synthase
MGRALALRGRVPEGRTVVAESGLRTAGDLRPLLDAGIGAFLVGGHLAASDDPEAALAELLAS